MLSAFSFGKIIKTFLPGTVLCAAMLLVLEALSRSFANQSIAPTIANKDVIVATTAALLPLSLLLGFVLNTVVWLVFNRRVARPIVRRQLGHSETYKLLRAALLDRLKAGLKNVAPAIGSVEQEFQSLEYFYLPVITLERHNQLWESYFSWYEFQANTAFAVMFFAAALIFYLSVEPLKQPHEFWACLLIITLSIVGAAMLLVASIMNLLEFDRKFLVLVAASLEFQAHLQTNPAAGNPW